MSVLIWIQTVRHPDNVPEIIFLKKFILKSQQMTAKAYGDQPESFLKNLSIDLTQLMVGIITNRQNM